MVKEGEGGETSVMNTTPQTAQTLITWHGKEGEGKGALSKRPVLSPIILSSREEGVKRAAESHRRIESEGRGERRVK